MSGPERLEDVFQDEIIERFLGIADFKRFARSKDGLCLNEPIIQTIIEDNSSSVEEQKMLMLSKWRESSGIKATAENIRSTLERFIKAEAERRSEDKKNEAKNIRSTEERSENSEVNKDTERLEDVFQDDIIEKFSGIVDFKRFARSKNGLCLDDPVIQSIVDNNPHSVEEQKLRMLRKWKENSGNKATAAEIRSIAEKFREPEEKKVSQDFIFYTSDPLSLHSRIYRGEQRTMTGTRQVAIKLTSLDERSKREVDYLLRLSHHPNVVSLLQSGIYEESVSSSIYMVMERCRKENLEDFIQAMKKSGVSLPDRIKLAMSKQFLQGVEFIHSENIIHRDLKPSNVLISENEKYIKICDFGVSKGLSEGRSATNLSMVRIGTAGFRAPETYWRDVISQESDIFSSALVVHAILSDGEHAYGKDHDLWNSNIKRNKNCKLSVVLHKGKKPIKKLLVRMLEHEPRNRPTAEEVLKRGIFVNVSANLQLGDFLHMLDQAKEVIVMFGSKHLFSFAPVTKNWTRTLPMQEEVNSGFTLLVLEDCIHAFSRNMMCQMKYSDPKPEWTKQQITNEGHGLCPSIVALNDSIYVCGGGLLTPTQSVKKYRDGQWHDVTPLNVKRRHTCAVVVRGFILCIGGKDYNYLQSVEKFDEKSEQWSEIEPTPRPTYFASAVEKKNVLYVADAKGTQCFDIENETWKIIKPDHWPSDIKRAHIHVVNDELYLVFDLRRGVEIYHLDEKRWKMTLLCRKDDINMSDTNSITLKM